MPFVFAHLSSLLGFVMALLLLARAGEQRRPTGSVLAWLMAIVLVPYLGVPLYLVFGGRKLRRRAAEKGKLRVPGSVPAGEGRLATMLCASGAAPPTRGNQLTLLATGEAAFAEIVALISTAQQRIDISTLIFADDEVGQALAALLVKKAASGVRVRVLVDALFKFRSSRALIAGLRNAGIQVAWFMPIWSPWPSRWVNLRLHRKVVLVDEERAIVGGMNLAREYMGPAPMPGRWRDLSVSLTGPAVRDICQVFVSDWRFASSEVVPADESAPAVHRQGPPDVATDSVQVVGSGPDVESDRIYDALLAGTFDARRRLWVATPYFVPDQALLRALVLAVRRGLDVRVVVPRRSNHLTADLAGASYLRELAREGGSVRCYTPEMLHAKLVLIDDEIAVLGSANMDMRSLFLDYEIALVVTSVTTALQLEEWFQSLFAECVDLEPAGRARALLEPVARLLAPLE